MSNVIGVKNEPSLEQRIGDMTKDQVGYAVTWAYENPHINENFTLSTNGGVRIFATMPGATKPNSIILDDNAMQALIEWYTDGCCPVCSVAISHTEVICDSCFEQAKHYRDVYG